MKVKCIKSVFLYNDEKKNLGKVFTKGKTYRTISWLKEPENNCTLDDEGANHWIYKPGDKWFDKHFEVIK